MKQITNWRKATVFDVEADDLLAGATKIHILSYEMANGKKGSIPGNEPDRIRKFFDYHLEKGIPVVAHNGVRYDVPLIEKLLGMDLKNLMVIDTLFISWYLNTKRKSHGLDSFFEDYGIKKVVVSDGQWEEGDYELMKLRCETDVAINVALWKDFMHRLRGMYGITSKYLSKGLVGGTRIEGEEIYLDSLMDLPVEGLIDNCLTFLMFKADSARLREKTRWKADVDRITKLEEELSELILTAKNNLESVMPKVPKYTKRNKPKVMRKKDGSLSAAGVRWTRIAKLHNKGVVDGQGNKMAIGVDEESIKELTGYDDPNANGHQQIKDFLFLHGWEPESFDFKVDKKDKELWASSGFKKELKPVPRKVPQVSVEGDNGKELCPSVVKLMETVPEIENYSKYTLVKHRLDMVKGWLERLEDGQYLTASIRGTTNCVTADTLILTDKGQVPIVEVNKGDQVLTHEGVYRIVTDWIDNGVKSVIEVKFSSGKVLRTTPNHRIMGANGEWIYVKDLKKGDKVQEYGEKECWKDIEGHPGCKISSWGRVVGTRGKLYKVSGRAKVLDRNRVTLPYSGNKRKGKDYLISRLVAKYFIGDSDLHVCHKDGNPTNNNVKNLYYGTDADNWEDTKLHGTHLKAVRSRKNVKLSMEKADEIRVKHQNGRTQTQLAEEYGVSSSHISNIVTNKMWQRSKSEVNHYREVFDEGVVVSVEPIGELPTYDISVDDSHSYIANGVVSHNTLRDQHAAPLVNLPGIDKPYGEDIRGSLICEDNEVLLGTDLSSLDSGAVYRNIH